MTDLRTWPTGLRRLAEVIGPAAAVRLSEVYGGTVLYVHRTMSIDHPVVQVIGLDKAEQLAAEFATQTLEIPRGTFKDLKKARIIGAEGSSRNIALDTGCTQRYVNKVRAEARPDPYEPSLFDPPRDD
ncbi:MAG: hypothetical protein RLO01_12725 [Thalassobaculaceae bacterium]